MNEQTEIPDVPPAGRLKKLREVLPSADAIIRYVKAIEGDMGIVTGKGVVSNFDARALGVFRRALAKRLGALGAPLKVVAPGESYPDGTCEAAAASVHVREALAVAMSAIAAVNAAERGVIGS